MTDTTPDTNNTYTLDEVLKELQLWRSTKEQHRQHELPDELWLKIFALSAIHSETRIKHFFGLGTKQYRLSPIFAVNSFH